jgi:hypothetical protein
VTLGGWQTALKSLGTLALIVAVVSGAAASAQRAGAFGASRGHPAIAYSAAPVDTVITALNARLDSGQLKFSFDESRGYLSSVLDALALAPESQVLVYSETSFQARRINRYNPRAVYFDDHVAVGWVRGGEVLEIAAQDPRQGTVFYTLAQTPVAEPRFSRNDGCLSCHLSWETLAVPGPFVLTTMPRRSTNDYANGSHVDARVPLAERWGGWYVTGERVPKSMGNLEMIQPNMPEAGPSPVPAKPTTAGAFDLTGYLTPYSDVVALVVLAHQAHATNLITRVGWEYRLWRTEALATSALSPRVREAVDDLVDYFLFVDEAPLPAHIKGSAGFAEKFSARGPRDGKGRSLRDLQLQTRLMRYPLSYMIYSPGFKGLPDEVKAAVYARIDEVLSGRDKRPKYAHLTAADRVAVAEILAATR